MWYQIALGRLGARGDCTGGTHMPGLHEKHVYNTNALWILQLSGPVVQWSDWPCFSVQTRVRVLEPACGVLFLFCVQINLKKSRHLWYHSLWCHIMITYVWCIRTEAPRIWYQIYDIIWDIIVWYHIRYHSMISWYDVMIWYHIWYHTMISWYDIIPWYDNMISWYHGMMSCVMSYAISYALCKLRAQERLKNLRRPP